MFEWISLAKLKEFLGWIIFFRKIPQWWKEQKTRKSETKIAVEMPQASIVVRLLGEHPRASINVTENKVIEIRTGSEQHTELTQTELTKGVISHET